MRRWQRRRRRLVKYLALALVAFAVAISLAFVFYFTPESAVILQSAAGITLATPLLGVLSFGVYAIWRYDRTRRRLRGAQIRLRQVEHRLRSVPRTHGGADSDADSGIDGGIDGSADGGAGERRLA